MPNEFDIFDTDTAVADSGNGNPFDTFDEKKEPEVFQPSPPPNPLTVQDPDNLPDPFGLGSHMAGAPVPSFSPDKSAAGEIGSDVMEAAITPGKLAYSGAADLVSKAFNDPRYGGNIPAMIRGDESLPAEKFVAESAREAPNLAVAANVGRSLSEMAPMAAVGGLPSWAGKLIALGFSADMIRNAPELSRQLAEEINKPEKEQDPGKLAELKSQALQTVAFAPLAAAHGAGRAVESRVAPVTHSARLLSEALQAEPGALPVPVPGTFERRLGVRPDSSFAGDVLSPPPIQALADRALAERTGQALLGPRDIPAADLLKQYRAGRTIVPDQGGTMPLERPGGGEAIGGKVSFSAPAEAEAIPSARQSAVEPETKGETNASKITSATTPDGDLRTQPVEGEQALPAKESGGGVQPQASAGVPEAKAGEVPLEINKLADLPPEKWRSTLKESGGDLTGLAYKLAEKISADQIPDLENAREKWTQENRDAQSKVKTPEDFNSFFSNARPTQFFEEAKRFRQAMDEAIKTGAKTKEEFAKIEQDHGVGRLDRGQTLMDAVGRSEKISEPVDNLEISSVTPLDPATGSPLTATEALLNKLEPAPMKPEPPPTGAIRAMLDREGKRVTENGAEIGMGARLRAARSSQKFGGEEGFLQLPIEHIQRVIDWAKEKFSKPDITPSEAVDLWRKSGSPIDITFPRGGVINTISDSFRKVRDYVTIDPTPRLARYGSSDSAAQHAYARSAVPRMVDDYLAKVFPDQYKNPEAMSRTMDILNKDDILGGYDEFVKKAEQGTKDGDEAYVKKYRKLAQNVGDVHDIEAIRKEVQAAASDPVISENIKRWKSVVNSDLDQLYNEMKGVDPGQPREGRGAIFGARVNLLPKSEESNWINSLNDEAKPQPAPTASNYRNPNAKRDKFDRIAKFTGNYSTNPAAVLANVLAPRWNEVTKIRFFDDLVNKGAAQWSEPGHKTFSKIEGEDTASVSVKVPETNAEGITRQVEKSLVVPKSLVPEIRGVLNTDMKLSPNPVGKILTGIQLAQLADATSHLKNIHSVVVGAQGTKALWSDIAKKMPGLASADALARMAGVVGEISSDTPAIRAELSFMAKNGMLRDKYPATGIQKITKMQDVIHHADTAARVIMNRFYDNMIDRGLVRDDIVQRRRFVQQVGEYNKRLMSPMMRLASQSGVSPFIVAGRNFNRFGRRTLTGDPGVEGSDLKSSLQMRLVNLSLVAGVLTIPMMVNKITTGSIYGRRGTPIGAIDLNGKEDQKGAHQVLDLAQLYGVRRGMRSTGVDSIVEGSMAGKSADEIVGKAIHDVTSAAAHPWVGPAVGGAYSALTGQRLDLRGGPTPVEARKVGSPYSLSQIKENLRVTLKNQNQLLYGAARPLFGDIQESYGKDFANDFLRSPFSAGGIRNVKSPETAKAQELAMRSEASTPEQLEKAKLKRAISEAIRSKDEAKRSELINSPAAKELTNADKTDIRQRASMSPLKYEVHKFLSPSDSIEVYKLASDENKKMLKPIILEKIKRSPTLDDAEKRNLADQLK